MSSEEDDQAIGQILQLQKDVKGMGAVRRGSRMARIGATALATATVAVAACAAGTAAAASAATAGPAKATANATAAAKVTTAAKTVSASVTTPGPYTPPSAILSEGSSGAGVKSVQQRLAALKYYPGTIDGQFGSDTEEAVWAFQEVNRIPVTGVIDAATKRALVHPRTYVSNDPRQDSTRVEVNQALEVLVLYKKDKIELISHVSTGGGYWYNCGGYECQAVTPDGNYRTTVFMPGWVTVPLGQMYNPVFFISTVYAIHGDTEVPVYPASHGCVRVPMDIAQFFHTLVSTPGTEVFVYGKAQWEN
jgi:peptidoglycan hydrolase-like protein with peptidoglycan-binding domain